MLSLLFRMMVWLKETPPMHTHTHAHTHAHSHRHRERDGAYGWSVFN